MKRLWNSVLTTVQPLSMWLFAILLLTFLFTYKIGSLVPGVSQQEKALQGTVLTFKSVIDNPINAPYKVSEYAIGKVKRSIATQRLVSAGVAVATVALFYVIASRLVKRFSALAGTLMFATSSSLLHAGRLGTPAVMQLTLFALIVCCYAVRFSPRNGRWLLLCSAAISLSLYTPGLIYFILLGGIWQYRTVKKILLKTDKPMLLTCGVIILASLLPIMISMVLNHGLVREYLGMPKVLPTLGDALKTAASVPLSIFVASPSVPLYRLGHQAVLDVFGSAMFIFGCYSLLLKRALDRGRLLLGILFVTLVWCAVGDNFENSLLLLPFIFLVVTVGLGWFVNKWLDVFPRNPLARLTARVLISLCVLLACNFQLQRYFLAWPNTPAVKAAFIQK